MGIPLYAVGGFVRDSLLGRDCSDIDLASAFTPDELDAFLTQRGISHKLTCARLGTVVIALESGRYEHTTFRRESYGAGGGHEPVSVAFTKSLKEDAKRRDFSVNALYLELDSGELIDPVAGCRDIEKKLLRTTTFDPYRILSDDGLRIMRLARFTAQLGFETEENTLVCAKENAVLLGDIAPERKRDELMKLLGQDDVLKGLEMMSKLDGWRYVIPELDACKGLKQQHKYHIFDVQGHCFHVCAKLPKDDVVLRLAGLIHDLAKGVGEWRNHDVVGEGMARAVMERLRFDRGSINRVCAIVRDHMYDMPRDELDEETVRKRFASWGRVHTKELLQFRDADIKGCGGGTMRLGNRAELYNDMLRRNTPFALSELKLSGTELMNELHMQGGERVGELLNELWMHCAVHPEDNETAALLALSHSL